MRQHASGWFMPDAPEGAHAPGCYLGRSAMIESALAHWPMRRRHVVQAGGHIGIWPVSLAGHFDRVTCFEPVAANYECLCANTAFNPRIHRYRAALAKRSGVCVVSVQPKTTGGHHMATRLDRPYETVQQIHLDTFKFDDVDAIFLDVEGYEYAALHGAAATIARCRPMLVIEDNGASRRYGVSSAKLRAYVSRLAGGYTLVATYGEDTVWVPT